MNIKFIVKLKKSAAKIFQILTEAYGDEALSRAHVFEWHKWFSGGIDSVEDDEPAGRPKSGFTDRKIAKMRDMRRFPLTSVLNLKRNPFFSLVEEVQVNLGCSFGESPEGPSKILVPELLPAMVAPNAEVCEC
ncbi:hypothetical protein TNCV_1346471 [Trichonephila clavipes]|nr:hypothetical protein TNCV_1346471 [Trichonephila clavipes]